MQKDFLSYLKKIFIFSLLIVLIIIVIYSFIPKEYYTCLLPFIAIFFLVLTSTAHYILIKNTYNNPAKFIRWFMSASTIKLIVHLMIMLVYAINYKTNAKIFILTYSLFYLFYTGFEIYIIISNKSKTLKETKKNN